MRSTKKLLSLMLALVMLLSVFPAAAFAAENEAEYAFSDSMQAFLSLESIVQLNVGFKLTADGADLSAAEAAALENNVGLLVWKGETAPADAAIETCDVVLGAVYNAAKGRYEVKTDGIPAKELGDALCFMPYYTDGMEYTYGRMIEGYSPKEYCYGQIAAGGSDTAVNAAILNYGAAAQEYFAYNTENLMNADLTEEQKALNWDGSLVRGEWAVPAEKEGELSRGAQIASRGGYLSLEGTIDVNFYFGADMDVADAEVLLWTEYAYNAEEVLAEENASLVKELTWNAEKSRYEYKYEGIAAKEMFSPVYACAKFTDAEGNVCYSGVVAYCAERYAYIAQNDADPALADLAKRIAIYGDAARTYFGNVELPDVGGGNEQPEVNANLTADVELNADGTVASEVSMSNGEVGATVPAGVAADKTTLTLQVSEKASSDADVEAGENETALSLDVHVDGVAASNTKAIIVELGTILDCGLNIGNVALYHVEDGATNEMTRVKTLSELDEHNEYYYDPVTGKVTVAMATFSEVVALADATAEWKGAFDYSWYNTTDTSFTIANADQLAAFGAIVGGMNGYDKDDFAGKNLKLISDINLGGTEEEIPDKPIFYPIGYYNSEGTYEKSGVAITSSLSSFEGVFDGNGHTVSNIYQNTWEMKGDDSYYAAAEQRYNDGMGLFGYVYNGTVKNLTVDNFSCDGEFTPAGCVAAFAAGESLFENIAVTNSNPRVYNTGNGGVIGIAGDSEESSNTVTLRNVTVDQTNKISALWGTYDGCCGGLVGRFRAKSPIRFENCHVAAVLDVYNDVCANYQYYWYRYSGMLIGSVHINKDGSADTSKITAVNSTYTIGDWNQYWYCELVKNTLASYTHDHQFSRLTEISDISEIWDGSKWLKEGNFVLPAADNSSAECYHIFKDEAGNLYRHLHADSGEETVNGETILKEDRQRYFMPFNQVLNGWGYGVRPTYTLEGFTEVEGGTTLSETKFVDNSDAITTEFGGAAVRGGASIKIGDLFDSIVDESKLSKASIYVAASPASSADTIEATYSPDTANWKNSTLTFSAESVGTARIVITDYFYCTPTVIYIDVLSEKHVLDLTANADHSGIRFTVAAGDLINYVSDPVSSTGKAIKINPAADENPSSWIIGTDSKPYFYIHDYTKDVNYPYMTRSIALSDLNQANKGAYYVKKFADVPINPTARSFYAFNDYVQYHSWNKMAGKNVDIYLSFRVEGNPSVDPVYYVDRLVAISKHVLSDSAKEISPATCTQPQMIGDLCTLCGHGAQEAAAPALGHSFDFSAAKTLDANTGRYNVRCSRCTVICTYGTMEELPQIVKDDLTASNISEDNVFDFRAHDGFRLGGTTVADTESPFGYARKFTPWTAKTDATGLTEYTYNKTYAVAGRGAMNFRLPTHYTTIADQILNSKLQENSGKGYQYYKMSWKIPEEGIGVYITGVFDWNFQFYGYAQGAKLVLDALAGQTVDVYVSLKVVGDVNNTTDGTQGPEFYFDRFIFVVPCQTHYVGAEWVKIEDATCGTGSVYQMTCNSCGVIKTQTNNDATGDHTCTYNAETLEAVCSTCGNVVKKFEVALPEELLTELGTSVSMDKVYDLSAVRYMGPTHGADGLTGDNSGEDGTSANDPWKVVDDTTGASPYSRVYRLAAVDYPANASKFILGTTSFPRFGVSNPSGLTFETYSADHLKQYQQDGKYHLYKFSCTYPKDYCAYLGFVNDSLRSFEDLWQLSHPDRCDFRGHNIDLYLSVRIEGEINNTGSSDKYTIWYVDRLIVVDRGTVQ